MADLETASAVSIGLAVLAGVVAAVEKLSGVRRDWRGRPMTKKHHADAPDSEPPSTDPVPVTRRGRPSLTTLSEQVPITRAEHDASVSAMREDIAELRRRVEKLDDQIDRLEVELVRGVGGINTRLERLRGRIASLFDLYGRGRR
jgi:hypothetical protein